jgi:protoporphyrinogen oxidase
MRSVTIVGAGVAGLTIAHQLAESGYEVTVMEANATVGGLARTFHYGDFHFDVGPHRFHTENARTAAFIRRILGNEAVEIPRRSGARMFGRIHEWPLRPSMLAAMPPGVMLRCARDLIVRQHANGDSFAADVINKYGRTLFEIFFEPYTQKFLSYSARELHRDWARAGVNRAVIDSRAKADNLLGLLRTTLLPKPVETMFLYPPHGVGRFSDLLAAAIVRMGGRILTATPVTAVDAKGTSIQALRSGDLRVAASHVVWTAPVSLLNRLLGIENIDLQFLSTIFFNVEVSKPPRSPYQWTYFGGTEVFSRVTAPEAFLPSTTPPGCSALCAEVTCFEGDRRWRNAEDLTGRVIAELVTTGMLGSARDAQAIHVERVPNTYPIYKLNYPEELARTLRTLGGYRNLLLAGRSGRFWYNNMDHSIGQGLTMADRIRRGDPLAEIDPADREFWAEAEEAAPAPTLQPSAVEK